MRVYLDNCCFNRPFDDQSSLVIRLETEAKLHIQDLINNGSLELCWSFVLDYENNANPFEEVRNRIAVWKRIAVCDCDLTHEISNSAGSLMAHGLRQMDATHLACAIYLGSDYFLTTDKQILSKSLSEIEISNPIDFVRRYFNA